MTRDLRQAFNMLNRGQRRNIVDEKPPVEALVRERDEQREFLRRLRNCQKFINRGTIAPIESGEMLECLQLLNFMCNGSIELIQKLDKRLPADAKPVAVPPEGPTIVPADELAKEPMLAEAK